MKNKTVTYKQFNSISEVLTFINEKNASPIILIDTSKYDWDNQTDVCISDTNPRIKSTYFTTGKFIKVPTDTSADIREDGWLDADGEGWFWVRWDNGEENAYLANTLGFIVDITDNNNNTFMYNCCDNPDVIGIDGIFECQNCLTIFDQSTELPTNIKKKATKLQEADTNTYVKVN